MKYVARYGKVWAKKTHKDKPLTRDIELSTGDSIDNYCMVKAEKPFNVKGIRRDEQNISSNT